MFFEGSLQEGIAATLQQSKHVACFVTDDGDESKLWENDFLMEEPVNGLLSRRAITFRLQAGSQEEGHLAQIYPLPKKPAMVIIKDAELREYVTAGVKKEEFLARIERALQVQPNPAQPEGIPTKTTATTPSGSSSTIAALANSSEGSATNSSEREALASAPGTTAATNQQDQQHIQAMLAERASRLEAQRKIEAEEEKRRRAEKKEAEANKKPRKDAQSKHASDLRKRQKEARQERERILRQIEDDKAARRARQSQREVERRAAAKGNSTGETDSTETGSFASTSQIFPSGNRPEVQRAHFALQIRLFDGSTIRSRFSSSDTLGKHVREWVDATTKTNVPYTFKVVLTPLPNRNIDAMDEEKTLLELDLAPSVTLILVPVVGKGKKRDAAAAAAYAEASHGIQGNIITRMFYFLAALATCLYGSVVSIFTAFLSVREPPSESTGSGGSSSAGRRAGDGSSGAETTGRDSGGHSAARIQGLRDRETSERGKQQFYNGNSTNFEPREEEEE